MYLTDEDFIKVLKASGDHLELPSQVEEIKKEKSDDTLNIDNVKDF